MKTSALLSASLIIAFGSFGGCGSTPSGGDSPVREAQPGGARRSVGGWVSCTGNGDDTAGLAKAFAAARHGAFTLVIDCPLRLKVGMDIAKPIFIDDGTTVEFSGAGKITVDNLFIPAFVIADSSHITLTDWNVAYDASLPIDQNVGGYLNDGMFVRGPKPANAFTDSRLTQWLAANRAIEWDRREGNVNAFWVGTTNPCAVFFITGDSSDISVTGMQLYVPANAGGERFIPVAFALGGNWRAGQRVSRETPRTAQYFSVPHGVRFSNIRLDGTYMGWVGGVRDAVFENVRSERYGDLQDANGQNAGGIGKWFAPPHLFYFGYSTTGDPGLFSANIRIRNVTDVGTRVGPARDTHPQNTSGYALSLKLGCVDCSVDGYRSDRPDGFMDVLPADGMTISNVEASYNSAFINNLFPGWRFPANPYRNLRFENIILRDTAAASLQPPIGNATQASNQGIVFKNVHVELNRWTGAAATPLPTIAGTGNDIALDYLIRDRARRIVRAQSGNIEVTLQGTPESAAPGAPMTLSWSSKSADRCTAGGAWSGSLPTAGTQAIRPATGAGDVVLDCSSGADHAQVRLPTGGSR